MFEDIDNMPPLSRPAMELTRDPLKPLPRSSQAASRARRQTMTAREIRAFDDMFKNIFEAVRERSGSPGAFPIGPQTPLSNAGIGRGLDGPTMSDLYGKLRRQSKKVTWTTAEDELLEKKKEEIELCEDNAELVKWARRELFEDSQEREEAMVKAIQDSAKKGKGSDSIPLLQSPIYPHLLATLIRTFRDKYRDPNLAIAMFQHAKNLSIASYVYGCTAPAYNEDLKTRWLCFRDAKRICDSLEEMKINGVQPDSMTHRLIESIRRDVTDQTVPDTEEEQAKHGELLVLVSRMESLVARPVRRAPSLLAIRAINTKPTTKRWSRHAEQWKRPSAIAKPDDTKDDDWEFGNWEAPSRSKNGDRRKPRTSPQVEQ